MSGEDLYSGTESMRSGLELDADKVEAFFREKVSDFNGNAEISQFKGGQSNPTYKVSSGRKSWVIRRKPPGQLLPSAHGDYPNPNLNLNTDLQPVALRLSGQRWLGRR